MKKNDNNNLNLSTVPIHNSVINLKQGNIINSNNKINSNENQSSNQSNSNITNHPQNQNLNFATNSFRESNMNPNMNSTGISKEKKSYKKRVEREEIEFPNIRTFQKEIMQKIYSKESGEILNILRKSNESIRSSKIMVYDTINNSERNNFYDTPKNENNDSDNNMNYFSSNKNFENYARSKLKNLNITEKNQEDESFTEEKSKMQENDNSLNNFNPEIIGFKLKKKNKSNDSNFNKFESSIQDTILRSKGSFTNRSNTSSTTEKINYKGNKEKDNNIMNTHNNTSNNFNMEEKSVYLTQSSKNGFPKILGGGSNKTLQNLGMNLQNNDKNNNSPKIPYGNSNSLYNFNNFNPNNLNSSNIFQNANNLAYLNSSNNSNTLNSINKALIKNSKKFFCPHCEHCNNIKDDALEKYFNMKEAKNIVKKSLDFIVTNYQTDQSYLDFLLGNNAPGLNYMNYINNHSTLQQINTNNNLHINNGEIENIKIMKTRTKFDIEVLLNTYPKHSNNRTVLQLVTHFLDALVNDKVSLDKIAGAETFEKIKDSLISQGVAFRENEGEIEFDKELDLIFDEATKEKLRKLFKKKFMNMKKTDGNNTLKSDEEIVHTKKRFMLLFLIFIQILSEIGSECKEKAVLLYKVFKLFFVEQEKKWTLITNHMKEKIQYYKELAKTVIQQKNKHLTKIEAINDCLFANKLSVQNLQDHKKLIQDLLNVINEKRDQIYLLQSENEILNRELNFWVYDFDKLKLDNGIREKLKELNLLKMVQNVSDEMSHKQVPENERALLVNADRFMIVSGHRNYFYDQKNYYLSEITRISELYEKCKFKKKSYKRNCTDMKGQMDREVSRLEKDIQYFRDKLSCEKKDILIQTEVDNFQYNKLLKNNNLMIFQRRMMFNKLTNFLEKIKFNCSKNKPISKKSVLNFIPELYNEKMQLDSKLDIEGKMKLTMDEFFLNFMKEKFKMSKIINRNCEQMLMSILKYSSEDSRIDLLRKFMGIGDDKIRREILDCYMTILKNLPISFYKIFEESNGDYLMTLENCMEIYMAKFEKFSINIDSMDKLLRGCTVIQNEHEVENLGLENKKDIFYLTRYYQKENNHFQMLLNSFKNKIKNEESYIDISDRIMIANKEYEMNLFAIVEILKRNFKMYDEKIQLDSFLDFFVNKYIFKIKITDFVQISIDSFMIIFSELDKYLMKMWNTADTKKNGIIFFKEFESVLIVLLGNSENKWKISEYFKIACDSPDKDFLSKDEFFSFCLNNKEILDVLLIERKPKLPKKNNN